MHKVINEYRGTSEPLDIDLLLNQVGRQLYRQQEARLARTYGFRPPFSAVMKELPFIFSIKEFEVWEVKTGKNNID